MSPALATGNCVILKPSYACTTFDIGTRELSLIVSTNIRRPFTPYTSLKLAELALEVFPPSVVQALGGEDDLGPLLVKHPGIQKISFTGSTATGKSILKAGADEMKRITLETYVFSAAKILNDDSDLNCKQCKKCGQQRSCHSPRHRYREHLSADCRTSLV